MTQEKDFNKRLSALTADLKETCAIDETLAESVRSTFTSMLSLAPDCLETNSIPSMLNHPKMVDNVVKIGLPELGLLPVSNVIFTSGILRKEDGRVQALRKINTTLVYLKESDNFQVIENVAKRIAGDDISVINAVRISCIIIEAYKEEEQLDKVIEFFK